MWPTSTKFSLRHYGNTPRRSTGSATGWLRRLTVSRINADLTRPKSLFLTPPEPSFSTG